MSADPQTLAPAATLPSRQRSTASVLAWIVVLYLASRLALLLIGLLSLHTVATPAVLSSHGDNLDSLFCRMDCGWYLDIVQNGYSMAEPQSGQTNLAFYPAYPMLVRGLSWLTGLPALSAGLLLSNLCFVAALFYLYRYARILGSSDTAGLLAVALVCFLPQGQVFSAMYTESLFLLLLIAAMYHLRRGHWLLAGLLAAALSATRATGIFFLVFAVAALVQQFGWAVLWRWWARPQIYLPVLLAPLGLFAFLWFNFSFSGDAFAMTSTVAHGWGWNSDWPWANLRAHLLNDAQTRWWALSSLLVGVLLVLLLPRRRWWPEFGLCLAMLLLLWSGQVANSLWRYAMVLFPVWIGLAQWLEARPLRQAAVFGSLGLFAGWMMVAWTLGLLVSI